MKSFFLFVVSLFTLIACPITHAQTLANDFDLAKSLATESTSATDQANFSGDILDPHFTATYTPVLDACFESLDEPDDAKFEIVMALDDSGKVKKVYRNLETNLGSCLIAALEKASFPRPPSAPYYFHVLLDKLAGNFTCPYDTILNEETRPELSVSWCEVIINGQTVFHGPYRAWWPNGRLGNEAHYDYGVPVGLWRGWYESGRLQGSNLYDNGVVVAKERYPDE